MMIRWQEHSEKGVTDRQTDRQTDGQKEVFLRAAWSHSVLPKVFWAPVLRTSGSWNLPFRMEGSLVRNFNNYYVLLIHVFDGCCSNRFDPCDHFNLVCCCLSPVLISDKRSCWKISQSLKPIWLYVEMLVPLFLKNQSVLQRCLSNFRAIGRLEEA